MTEYVVTGQPPSLRGRRAVGPLPNQREGQDAVGLLCSAGWTEVWLLPLDDSVLGHLMAAGVRPASGSGG